MRQDRHCNRLTGLRDHAQHQYQKAKEKNELRIVEVGPEQFEDREHARRLYQVVGWYLHGREIDPPKKLHAAEQAIEFHVRDVETGALLVLTKDPNGLGAMFDHNRRVTFHEA